MSRITGAMGHGLAALSLDKDYQRRRRDNFNKPPANLQEGLARSGKGLVMVRRVILIVSRERIFSVFVYLQGLLYGFRKPQDTQLKTIFLI